MSAVKDGTLIRFTYKDTEMQGVVISSSAGNYNVKLQSGYNLSIPQKKLKVVEELSRIGEKPLKEPGKAAAPSGRRKVGIIGTGGTIASRVDYITGAVRPVLNPGFLRESVSNIQEFSLDLNLLEAVLSENLTPDDWLSIARSARDMLSRNDGVAILHGTDTMSYTASALSFMFSELSGPVIFVGSQRSSDRPSSDAFLNLEAGLEFASAEFGEVGLAMHSGLSDDSVSLHRAVRSRKMHSSRRDAFESMGCEPMGIYQHGELHLGKDIRTRSGETVLEDKLEKKVSLVYFHPAMTREDFESQTEGKRAVVIMGTGLGHTGTRVYDSIRGIIARGDHVMMTTQCLYGSVNMNVYSTGRELLSMGVTPLSSILPEVAMIKAMYVLGNYPDEQFRQQMLTNLRGEVLERELIREVL